jgi:hypothetical protein
MNTDFKDTTAFFCNLDYLLIPIKVKELSNVLKYGLKPIKSASKRYLEAEPLLPVEERGVYSVAIFRQWKNKHMIEFDIDKIDPETEIVLKIDKSVVLYIPFHFNKNENDGRKDDFNTLVSDTNVTSSIWHYDVIRNLKEIMMNEVIFHKVINSAFIKEIWYFTENAPPAGLYNKHYKIKLIDNSKKLL